MKIWSLHRCVSIVPPFNLENNSILRRLAKRICCCGILVPNANFVSRRIFQSHAPSPIHSVEYVPCSARAAFNIHSFHFGMNYFQWKQEIQGIIIFYGHKNVIFHQIEMGGFKWQALSLFHSLSLSLTHTHTHTHTNTYIYANPICHQKMWVRHTLRARSHCCDKQD